VYTLLFSDTGLSVWQISSLFVIWSVSSFVLEVPSGACADATSRRRLLVVGPSNSQRRPDPVGLAVRAMRSEGHIPIG